MNIHIYICEYIHVYSHEISILVGRTSPFLFRAATATSGPAKSQGESTPRGRRRTSLDAGDVVGVATNICNDDTLK